MIVDMAMINLKLFCRTVTCRIIRRSSSLGMESLVRFRLPAIRLFLTRALGLIVLTDMSAAKHADVLFVKNDKPEGHNDLAVYVKKQGIKHILFKQFSEALPIVQSVVKREKTVQQVLEGSEGNKQP